MTDAPGLELLPIFKSLADGSRLRIVGLLATQPLTVEQLTQMLGLSPSTVSHHLAQLAQAGLVSARADGYYNVYQLETTVVEHMVSRLRRQHLPAMADGVDASAYDRKVLTDFSTPDGRLKTIPAQRKKLDVILRHLAKAFDPEVRYPEQQVNQILGRFHADTATLRRELVGARLLLRESGIYWKPAEIEENNQEESMYEMDTQLDTTTQQNEIMDYFKILTDYERLQIIGLLALGPRNASTLAEELKAKPNLVLRHLLDLESFGLLVRQGDQFSLDKTGLREKRLRLLAGSRPRSSVEDFEGPDYDRKVLHAYLRPDGTLKEIPLQQKKRMVILQRAVELFNPGEQYTERQVNDILRQLHPDTASLRRYLVDERFMARQDGIYWRVEKVD